MRLSLHTVDFLASSSPRPLRFVFLTVMRYMHGLPSVLVQFLRFKDVHVPHLVSPGV
jgi:hypothetical protein